jgi:hypothetical protein
MEESSFDLVPGETILLRANLKKEKWMKYRCVTCSLKCIATIYIAPICVPAYAFFAGSCRKEEADSFELILTNQNIHFRQMIYQYGFCCQTSGTKTIPLEKIQDIALISDWIGDSCGVVDKAGETYQLHVQTAAMGGVIPELCVYCIENPREFKVKVMDAKNKIVSATTIVGQNKTLEVKQTDQMQQEQAERIIKLLEKQVNNKV